MAQLDRDGEAFVLDLGDGENRFNPDSVAEIGKLLDEVEAADAPRALILSATGKFWSNGLDLEWMAGHADAIPAHVDAVHAMFARVLTLPLPTVAAIQGHCFAAGAMLALAADFRVMRADRGFFCLPEVDIHIPFTPGMAALIQARLTEKTAHEAMVTGRRYGGTDALAGGIVDVVAGEGEVLASALEIARPLAGKDGATMAAIKRGMYAPALQALAIPQTTGLG
jgi:enoyl-CoA hydratase/carnithine racemase